MQKIDPTTVAKERFTVSLAGHNWFLERSADLEALWESIANDDAPSTLTEFGPDERLPYWAEIWPASLGLGKWLENQREHIAGNRCLDLGCGLGLTSLVGASLGAQVVGLDYEWSALYFAQRNSKENFANNGHGPAWVQMDWRQIAFRPGSFQFIWGADIMYEKRFIEPVARFLDYNLSGDGVAWLCAPERRMFTPFNEYLAAIGFFVERTTREIVEHVTSKGPPVAVNVWEIRRKGPEAGARP